MGFDTPATAEGDLARTPFAHLLVYAVDRRLSGALFLHEPPGAHRAPTEHVVRFSRGTPVKVRPGDDYSLLGEMLVESGVLPQATLAEALATKGLLGDVLLLAGCVDRDVLEATCELQFLRRMTRLFTLPGETSFRYYEGHVALLGHGSEPSNLDALSILWAGLKAHGGKREITDATLNRLGELPLRIHPQSTVARFGLASDEAHVIERLRACPEPLYLLAERELLPVERLRRLVYALAITRQLDIGSSSLPVGANDTRRSTVARVQLKPTTHRIGAAAPDAPGDGERGAVSSRRPAHLRRPIFTPPDQVRLTLDSLDPLAAAAAAAAAAQAPAPTNKRDALDDSMTISPAVAVRTTADEDLLTPSPARANPQPAVSVRETLKSFGFGNSADHARRISVEVIDLHAPRVEPVASSPSAPPPSPSPPPPPPPPPPPQVELTPTGLKGLKGLSAPALFELAETLLAQRDLKSAEAACARGRRVEPEHQDLAALHAWIRAQRAGADLKTLTVELDELLSASPEHRNARYYRALLRKRLGDNAGAIRDLQRLRDRTPPDAEAMKELEGLTVPAEKPKGGLLGWLFKR